MQPYIQQLLAQHNSREMTEDELLNFYNKLSEQMEKNFWFSFQPRGIQQKVLNCFKKRKGFQIVMCIGGNQLGKSFASLHFLMDILTRRNEYRNWSKNPLHIAWFSKHRRFQRATIDMNLMKYCGEYINNGVKGRPGIDSQTGALTFVEFKNEPENGYYGDIIQWETAEMPASQIEGYVLDACIFDDIESAWEHFKYANQRLVSKEAPMLMSMLPPSDTDLPLYTHVLKYHYEEDKDEFEFINFAVADINDYAAIHGWDKVNYFKQIYTPEEFDRKIAGKPGKVTDMVYPFNKNKHVIQPFEIPKHWRRDISTDYATSDNKWVKGQGVSKELKKSATAAGFYAIPPYGEEIHLGDGRVLISTPEKILYFVYAEYYWTNEPYKRLAQDHAREICKLFKEGERFQSILIDCAVDDTAFSEMKKVFDAKKQPFFRKILHGSKTRFATEKKKQLSGHELVKQTIGNDQLFIMNNCTNFITAMENYKIDKNTQLPRVWGDHYPDLNRYFISTMPTYKDPDHLLLLEANTNPIVYDTSYLSDDYKISNYLLKPDGEKYRTGI